MTNEKPNLSAQSEFIKELQQTAPSDFVKWRSGIDLMYPENAIRGSLGMSVRSTGLGTLNDQDRARRELESALQNPKKAAEMSRTLAGIDANYASIIEYLQNMYYFRYTTTPVKLTEKKGKAVKASKEEYAEIYQRMVSIVEGINIPVTYPEILGKVLIEGVSYLYLDIIKGSEAVDTIYLPVDRCKPGGRTQFGTYAVQFDLDYIKELKQQLASQSGTNGINITFDDVLASLPEEMQAGYKAYDKTGGKPGDRWIQLNPAKAFTIAANDFLMPPRLSFLNARNDYNKIKKNEVTRSDNELVNILTHQIPTFEDETILDITEAAELHQGMSNAFKNEKGFKLLTTFGPTNMLSLSKGSAVENKAREQAFRTLYNDSGVNYNIFNGDSKESLESAWARDEASMRVLIEKITTAYKLSINTALNFKPYQLEFDILQINSYNYINRIKSYKESATLGVGRLQYIVASGMKQSQIQSQIELEDFLNLNELVPLSTSYTASGKEESAPKDQSKKKSENGRPLGSTTDAEPGQNSTDK